MKYMFAKEPFYSTLFAKTVMEKNLAKIIYRSEEFWCNKGKILCSREQVEDGQSGKKYEVR